MSHFVLPDLLALCPLNGATNLYYKEAGAESAAWVNSHNVFTDRRRAAFIQGHNELLVSHTYPYAGYEQFRTCCDLVNLLFVVDFTSDAQNGKDARATGQIFSNSLRDGSYEDDSILAKMTKEFRQRYLRLAGPNTARRFFNHCSDYVDAVAREAELREHNKVLDMEAFVPFRRDNSAVRVVFGLFEYALGIDLPQEVFDSAPFMEAYFAAVDMVAWANDAYSYNVEQAEGLAANNVVSVLMQEKHLDIQSAMDHVGVLFKDLMDRYTDAKSRLPSWGPAVDADVAQYIMAADHWVRGNIDWSFESQRYFGADHLRVKSTLQVNLLPSRPLASAHTDDAE